MPVCGVIRSCLNLALSTESTQVNIDQMLASKLLIMIDNLYELSSETIDNVYGWDNMDDVDDFYKQLENIRGHVCTHCGISYNICGCEKL